MEYKKKEFKKKPYKAKSYSKNKKPYKTKDYSKENKSRKKQNPKIPDIQGYIMFLLARRDYSEKEIRTKSNERFESPEDVINDRAEDLIEDVIASFIEKKYISDERFTESFVHYKYEEGYGKVRLKNEMRTTKGISDDMMNIEFEKYDWFERAKDIKQKKYGDEIEEDYKTLNKQKQHLLRRGFSFDEVAYAFGKENY
jgi:regulatory protein